MRIAILINFCLAVFLGIFSPVSHAQTVQNQFETFPVDQEFETQLKQIADSPFFIDVFINDAADSFKAYVDTGATNTIISEKLSSKLALSWFDESILAKQARVSKLPLYLSKDHVALRLRKNEAPVYLQPLLLRKHDLQAFAHSGIVELFNHVDMVIGIDFLNHTTFQYSSSSRQLSILIDEQNSDYLDVTLWEVPVTIHGEEYKCKLDTGAEQQGGVTFAGTHKAYDHLRDKFEHLTWSYSQVSNYDWSQTGLDKNARIEGLSGKGLLVHFEPRENDTPITADVSDSDSRRCLVGLRTFDKAILSYSHGSLELTGQLPPVRYHRSGLRDVLYSPGDRVLWVKNVWPHSDAYKKGLQSNFVITAINGLVLTPEEVLSVQDLLYDEAGTKIELEWYEGPDENGKFGDVELQTTIIELTEILE